MSTIRGKAVVNPSQNIDKEKATWDPKANEAFIEACLERIGRGGTRGRIRVWIQILVQRLGKRDTMECDNHAGICANGGNQGREECGGYWWRGWI